MTTSWAGTSDPYLDTRDLEAYAEDEDNQKDDPDTVAAINALRDEGISDWHYGETLIRDDHFVDHARTLAEDIGAIEGTENRWPLYCIDWEQAAKDLQQDYSQVEFLGHDYWVRA